MSAQHTPGPWRVNVQGNTVRGESGFVCSLNDVSPADARLIIAAPEMLALLQETLQPGAYGIRRLAVRIEAAIAKATGSTT